MLATKPILLSPPQGNEREVSYTNGDYLYLRFVELKSKEQAIKQVIWPWYCHLAFSLTAVESHYDDFEDRHRTYSSKLSNRWFTTERMSIVVLCGGVLIQHSGLPRPPPNLDTSDLG